MGAAGERLHKLLAQHGVGSRRQVEAWIREGRVLVNGEPASVGQRVGPADKVVVDGRDVTRLLAVERAPRLIIYHKPSGEMLSRQHGDDREGVEANLPHLHGARWVAVNSLGYGEDGLLVLSSDGGFASAIARRARELPVEYRVRALRPRQEEDWPELPLSVATENGVFTFSAVEQAGSGPTNMWYRVAAETGVPRGAVRDLFDQAGLKVSRVLLLRWGPVQLPRDLPRGRSREITGEELEALAALAGRPLAPPPKPKGARDAGGRASRSRAPGRRSVGR